jgi:hypothetical protein
VRALGLTAGVERAAVCHTDAALEISFFHFPLLTRLAGALTVSTAGEPAAC